MTAPLQDSLPQIPPIGYLFDELRKLFAEERGLWNAAVEGGMESITSAKHLVAALMLRSRDTTRGFVEHVNAHNRYCALALGRLQFDSAMSAHAMHLVDDVDGFVRHMLEGGEKRKFHSRDGKPMSDDLLHRSLSERYEADVSEAYWHGCGFVHCSCEHLFSVFTPDGLANQNAKLIGFEDAVTWTEEGRAAVVVEFIAATHMLLEECRQGLAQLAP